jgi:hypothetical protein
MELSVHQKELIGMLQYKVERLNALSHSSVIYDTIECAGIIRDLILSDENGIFGAILRDIPNLRNKRNRKLIFVVKLFGFTNHKRLGSYISIVEAPKNAAHCAHYEFPEIQQLRRDDFLRLPVICAENGHYTVKDLVSFTANKLGSRHFDRYSGSNDQLLLHEIRDAIGMEGFDPVITPIKALSRVDVATGEKLIIRIEKTNQA